MLDLNMHFLKTASGGLWVKLTFVCDFGTYFGTCMLIYIMRFIRSVSDHDKYGIKLKLSTVGVHSCVVLVVSVVAIPTVAKNQLKTEEKRSFL